MKPIFVLAHRYYTSLSRLVNTLFSIMEGVQMRTTRFLLTAIVLALACLSAAGVEPKPSIDTLVKQLNDPDALVRVTAAGQLVGVRDERGVSVLIESLTDKSLPVRTMAVRCLGGHMSMGDWGMGEATIPGFPPPVYDPRMVAPLISLLKDPDQHIRAGAAGVLGWIKEASAAPKLETLAQFDHSPLVRAASLGALTQIASPSSAGTLVKILTEGSQELLYPVSAALMQIKDPSAIPAITAGMKTRNPDVRSKLVECLGEIKDPKAVDTVIAALNDPSESVRWAAAEALADSSDPRAVDALGKAFEKGLTVHSELKSKIERKSAKAATTEKLIADLKSKNPSVRLAAAQALGKRGDTKAVEPLIAAVPDPVAGVNDAAILALGSIGDERAVAKLTLWLNGAPTQRLSAAKALMLAGKPSGAVKPMMTLAKGTDLKLKRQAIAVLGGIGDRSAVDCLISLLPNPKVRNSAITALGRIGGPKAAKALVPCLKDDYPASNGSYDIIDTHIAATALADAGDTSIVPDLVPFTKDPNPRKRADTAWLFGELKDPRAVDALIPLLKDNAGDAGSVAESAAQALGNIGGDQAIQALLNALKSDRLADESVESLGQARAAQAVEPLIGLLKTPLAPKAAAALGKIGDKRASEPLLALLNSPFPTLWPPAVEALGELRETRATDRLVQLMPRLPEAAVALGMMKDKRGLPVLIAELKRDENGCCADICRALGELADPSAVDPLIGVLRCDCSNEAKAAILALGKIGDKRAIEPLMKLLKDVDRRARGGALPDPDETPDSPPEPNVAYYYVSAKEWDYRPELFTALTGLTGQNLGQDSAKWLGWWAANSPRPQP